MEAEQEGAQREGERGQRAHRADIVHLKQEKLSRFLQKVDGEANVPSQGDRNANVCPRTSTCGMQ
jgi:hypothetical protein